MIRHILLVLFSSLAFCFFSVSAQDAGTKSLLQKEEKSRTLKLNKHSFNTNMLNLHTLNAPAQRNGTKPGFVKVRPLEDKSKAIIVVRNNMSDLDGQTQGFQMLFDSTATAYGKFYPVNDSTAFGSTVDNLPTEEIYKNFCYKIPQNADHKYENFIKVAYGEQTLEIKPGKYDVCVTTNRWAIENPNGNIEFRGKKYSYVHSLMKEGLPGNDLADYFYTGNDVVFEAGWEYDFDVDIWFDWYDPSAYEAGVTIKTKLLQDNKLQAILSPTSGLKLSSSEEVEILIQQMGREKCYTKAKLILDGKEIATEEVGEVDIDTVYKFKTKINISAEKTYKLEVELVSEADGNAENNRISTNITNIKTAFQLPFECHFDPSKKDAFGDFADMSQKWLQINPKGDVLPWRFLQKGEGMGGSDSRTTRLKEDADGTDACIISGYTNMPNPPRDNYLRTLAPIHLKQGSNTITYRYRGVGYPSDGPDLFDVVYSRQANLNGATKLGETNTVKTTDFDAEWEWGYRTFEVPNEADYYFAFHVISQAGGNEILLDDIQVYAGEYQTYYDMYVKKIEVPISRCNQTNAQTIRITLDNKGSKDAESAKLKLDITRDGSSIKQIEQIVNKAPGKTSFYNEVVTITDVDITPVGEYKLTATVVALENAQEKEEAGALNKNNTKSVTFYSHEAMDLPLYTNFKNPDSAVMFWDGAKNCTDIGCYVFDTNYGLNFAVDAPPIYSRCVNMEEGKSYRIKTSYMAGVYSLQVLNESWEISYSKENIGDVSTWNVVLSTEQEATGGLYREKSAIFECTETGVYNFALNPTKSETGLYFEYIDIREVSETDIKVDGVLSNIGVQVPVAHSANANFDIKVSNVGIENVHKVSVAAKLGDEELGKSEELEILISERSADFFIETKSAAMENVGDEREFSIVASMEEGEQNEDDNTYIYKVLASDTVYAFDGFDEQNIDFSKISIGTDDQLASVGYIYKLETADTLTALRLGLGNMKVQTLEKFPFHIDVMQVNKDGKLEKEIRSYRVIRNPEGGKVDYSFEPALVLDKGLYFIGVRYEVHEVNVLSDEAKFSTVYVYDKVQQSVFKNTVVGNLFIRAIFGHNASNIINKDVEVLSIDKPSEKSAFTANQEISATIKNNGHQAIENIKVECIISGPKTAELSKTIAKLEGYDTISVDFEADLSVQGNYRISIKVSSDEDEDDGNNELSKEVVSTTANPYLMDFELCEDFAIDNFVPAWKSVDLDEDENTFTAMNFKNNGVAKGFIVFNPSAVEPEEVRAAFPAQSGNKYGASMDINSNNYLISPKLKLGAVEGDVHPYVSMYVKNALPGAAETYQILVSTTDDNIESFKALGPTVLASTRKVADGKWNKVVEDLSEYAEKDVYIAIRCMSQSSGGFFAVDSIYVGSTKLNIEGAESNLGDFIRLYPNPVVDNLTITAFGLDILDVEICNLTGLSLYKSAKNLKTEMFRYSTNKLASGVYFAKIRTNKGTHNIRFTVVK